jgi:hypothetical protein
MNKDNVSTEVAKIETSSTGEKVVVTLRPVCKGICSTTYSLVPILYKLFKMQISQLLRNVWQSTKLM